MKVSVYETPSQSFRVSFAELDHAVLPATQHKWTYTALSPARTGWYSIYHRFTYPRGMESWVDLGGWLHAEMGYLSTEGHPSKY